MAGFGIRKEDARIELLNGKLIEMALISPEYGSGRLFQVQLPCNGIIKKYRVGV
jgi:hypothetical protein